MNKKDNSDISQSQTENNHIKDGEAITNGIEEKDDLFMSMTRRDFHRLTLSGLISLILGITPPRTANAAAQLVMSQLSPGMASAYMKSLMARQQNIQLFIDFFNGFEFHLDRSKVFSYFPFYDGAGPVPRVALNFLGILPSFKSFDYHTDPSHQAISIVVHHTGNVLAASVTVNHNPFEIVDYTVYEINPYNGNIASATISTNDLDSYPVDGGAALIGMPTVDPSMWQPQYNTLNPADEAAVVALTFGQLINDSYAQPLYPPGAITMLLSQTPSVQKFASVNYSRYKQALGQGSWCTSTSTSCNACSSTSTSSFSCPSK